MNKIEVPKTFELGRVVWNVVEKDYIPNELIGLCQTGDTTILLAKQSRRQYISQTLMINTFYHEVCHAIMCAIDYGSDIFNDETMMTALGDLIFEFDLTKDNNEIPTSFEMARVLYNVIEISEEDNKELPKTYVEKGVILIPKYYNSQAITQSHRLNDFYKEFVKLALKTTGYDNLANDNKFIILFGLKLREFCDTRSYAPVILDKVGYIMSNKESIGGTLTPDGLITQDMVETYLHSKDEIDIFHEGLTPGLIVDNTKEYEIKQSQGIKISNTDSTH